MVHFVEDGGESDDLAPVIPLFGTGAAGPNERRPAPRRVVFAEADDDHAENGYAPDGRRAVDPPADPVRAAADAQKALVRKLAVRQLSVAEARSFLRERDVAEGDADEIVAEFEERRYLDDARLAEQLVYVGTERKGQGRQAIAMTMSSRGVPRDVADAALDAMPDDESERALAFARDRARRLDGVDETAALRRLLGQLARRGFGGHAATEAARTALAERSSGGGVRFS